jgi:hypothetical protein
MNLSPLPKDYLGRSPEGTAMHAASRRAQIASRAGLGAALRSARGMHYACGA